MIQGFRSLRSLHTLPKFQRPSRAYFPLNRSTPISLPKIIIRMASASSGEHEAWRLRPSCAFCGLTRVRQWLCLRVLCYSPESLRLGVSALKKRNASARRLGQIVYICLIKTLNNREAVETLRVTNGPQTLCQCVIRDVGVFCTKIFFGNDISVGIEDVFLIQLIIRIKRILSCPIALSLHSRDACVNSFNSYN